MVRGFNKVLKLSSSRVSAVNFLARINLQQNSSSIPYAVYTQQSGVLSYKAISKKQPTTANSHKTSDT